jgi:hypothetical protein
MRGQKNDVVVIRSRVDSDQKELKLLAVNQQNEK